MDRSEFAGVLQRAVVGLLSEFRYQAPHESPYALAVIPGQSGGGLSCALATEEGLQEVAARYADLGYRYRGWEWEEFDNQERLAVWLRWANPDDGWKFVDFPDRFGIAPLLAGLVGCGAFGQDAEELEEFCTESLSALQANDDWLASSMAERIVVGVTYGEDPRDFLRTATRANSYTVVQRLWVEHMRGEELSSRISSPR